MWLQFKIFLFTLTVCLGENVEPVTAGLDSLFREIGFTPSCVSQTLALCEDSQSSSLLQVLQAQLKPIIGAIEDLKSDMEESKSGGTELKSDIKELKFVSEDSKLVGEGLKLDIKEVKLNIEESKLDIKEVKLNIEESKFDIKELKTVVEHSNSAGEEMKSDVEEMKAVVEELKTIVEKSNSVIKEMKWDVKTVMKFSKTSARNCADLLKMGDTESGVRTVQMFPLRPCGNGFAPVFCDQATDGGGWTVIQRRADLPQREDFFRGWVDYQLGFGNLTGEFWLGLDNIHALVNKTQMELRVDLEDFDGEKRWAKYDLFNIEDSAGKYRLKLGNYTGDAGDSLSYTNNNPFSSKDADNDPSDQNCAETRQGAWWYGNCTESNLNGFQHRGSFEGDNREGITWYKFRNQNYSLKSTLLSVRPRFRN